MTTTSQFSLELDQDQKADMCQRALMLFKFVEDSTTTPEATKKTFKEFFTVNAYPLQFPTSKFTSKQVSWWKNQFSLAKMDIPDYLGNDQGSVEGTLSFLMANAKGAKKPITNKKTITTSIDSPQRDLEAAYKSMLPDKMPWED